MAIEVPFALGVNWISHLAGQLSKRLTGRRADLDELIDTFGDPTPLADTYVEPDCQQFNPADSDDEDDRYLVKERVFHRIEHFLSGPSGSKKNRLLVLADAGMGKTSLLVMLRLAHISSFWPKGYDCILKKLDDRSLDEIRGITGRSSKVLLLDGLDEDPSAWGRVSLRLAELLDATSTFRRVIITCRTQFFSAGEDPFNRRGQVEVGGHVCPVIYLSLFNEEQVNEYCSKRWSTQSGVSGRVVQLLGQMQSLRCRPMLLANIEAFLDSNRERWTEFTVYDALLVAWLNREQGKLRLRRDPSCPTVGELRHACRVVALAMHETGKRTLAQVDIEMLTGTYPALAHIQFMDIGGRSLLNRNSSGQFRFAHYSIQEFLVVDALVSASAVRGRNQYRVTGQMLTFVRSWLAESSATALSSALLARLDFHGSGEVVGLACSGAELGGVRFSGVDVRTCRFDRARLEGADFSKARVTGTTFHEAMCSGAGFTGAVVSECDFGSADLAAVDFSRATLTGTSFRGAKLSGARFEDSTLIGCDFTEASVASDALDSVVYSSDTRWPVGLSLEQTNAMTEVEDERSRALFAEATRRQRGRLVRLVRRLSAADTMEVERVGKTDGIEAAIKFGLTLQGSAG
jgi:uncharacterized protein YjbI with pentapeptide repeats